VVKHQQTGVKLRFIDIMMYAPVGDLKTFVSSFSKNTTDNKGVFPYDSLDITINTNKNRYIQIQKEIKKILLTNDAFSKYDFNKSLKNTQLNVKDYAAYLEDRKNYNSRLEYLIAYNIRDCLIMVEPINNLIKMFEDLGIDMFNSLSLSGNASAVKHKMLDTNFDVNTNCDIKSENEKSFIPTFNWAADKVSKYNQQDKRKKRDTNNNITHNELLLFSKANSKCYICQSTFTDGNKPTLDRINNSIGHTLKNVKPCCEYCNKIKSDKNEDFARYKIQLKKYCLMNNLPMTLTDEVTYHILRDGITGGLSNVGHRFNYAGITKINKLEIVKNGDGSYHVFSTDANNIMTHITGCDFSSLYPSVFSSNSHPFIPYTGHKMYMPGYQTSG
jgi:hypothetical protein